jgi:MoxR-like ATPase
MSQPPQVPGVDPQVHAACEAFRRDYRAVQAEIAKAIVGHEDIVDGVLTCLFVGGHALLEGVPGLGKTALIRALSQALHLKFNRIQFTPDLMPSDVIGTNIIAENEQGRRAFQFVEGPIFAQIVLADEINRATPKTQSALLEAMQERQVTLADTTFPLDDPFWVLATQNPVEQEGVYTLPEAQLDRFSMMLRVGYPSQGEEVEMLQMRLNQTTIAHRVSPSDVTVLRDFIDQSVYIDPKILEYIVRLGRATRDPGSVGRPDLRELLALGISPRSYQHLLALSRVTAFLHGRTWAMPDDVKEIFCDATRHRIARTVRAQAENVHADEILEQLLGAVPIP